uniref:Type IV secretion-system, TraD, DNA-binding domain protein n=1 Tax=Thiomonas intermedia (strain K12) TaxID=75379 RepID=D5X4X7_THIK1
MFNFRFENIWSSYLRPSFVSLGILVAGLMAVGVSGFFLKPILSAAVFVPFAYFAYKYLSKNFGAGTGSGKNINHLRGAAMVGGAELDNLVIARYGKRQTGDLHIAGIRIPREFETRGFMFAGAPGTGKSVAITSMLDIIYQRGDAAFIADRSGIYAARYYNPQRDIILNPIDARAHEWSPLAEMRSEYDSETIAKSIIPDAPGDAAEWNHYAQTILAGILLHAWRAGLNNSAITRLAQRADMAELKEILADHAGIGLLQNEKMFGSIRGILATYTIGLARLLPQAGRDGFSLSAWVHEQPAAFAFFPYLSDQMKPMRGIIAALADVYADAVLTLPPDANRRLWLVLDEFASLGRVDSMENFLTNARKHGGCSILGMQALSQVHSLYGRDNATSMLSSISTRLTLRAPDAETAEYLSRGLGDKQVVRTMRSGSRSSSKQGGSNTESWNQQIATERLVLPAEIMRTPDLVGYLQIAGDLPVGHIRLSLPPQRPDAAHAFTPRAAAPTPTPEPAPAPELTPTPDATPENENPLDGLEL